MTRAAPRSASRSLRLRSRSRDQKPFVRFRLRPGTVVSIAPTTGSVRLCSGSRKIQIDTPHLPFFTTEILPLLDGTRVEPQTAALTGGYSSRGILRLLSELEEYGILQSGTGDVGPTLDGKEQQRLKQLLSSWIEKGSSIIEFLTCSSPDSSQLNLAWTSRAVVAASRSTRHPNSRTGSGVGLSALEAMTKAAAEALEVYGASHYTQGNLYRSSLKNLREDFLDPRDLCLYQRKQYQPDFPYAPITPNDEIYWTRGRWLETGRTVWLPALVTFFDRNFPEAAPYSQVTSSGLATGSNVADASLRAIWELIERDAFMITWLSRSQVTRIIPDTALGRPSLEILGELEARGIEVRLYLLSGIIEIPIVLCVAFGDGKIWPGATVGLGAHQNPVTATRKAILEQVLLGSSVRNEMLAGKLRIPKTPKEVMNILDHGLYYIPKKRARAFHFLESKRAPVSLSDLEPRNRISLKACVKELNAAGVRVAIKNLTPHSMSAERRFCVVRALATRLQPIHFGFNRERLAGPRLRRLIKNRINSDPHPLT